MGQQDSFGSPVIGKAQVIAATAMNSTSVPDAPTVTLAKPPGTPLINGKGA